jgi:diguanylate cyclase (GGDEF)-like protein
MTDSDRRDQAAGERERAAAQRGDAAAERDVRQARQDVESSHRAHAAGDRDDAASGRDRAATVRDRSASGRDHAATARAGAPSAAPSALRAQSDHDSDRRTADRGGAADDRRAAASDRRAAVSDRDRSEDEARERTSLRAQAANDRAHDIKDRRQAIADRAADLLEREQAAADLLDAQTDQLTGAHGRQLGALLCSREINRARHGDGRLVLAYVDVDGLKAVNDEAGHHAGDALLVQVVDALKDGLRSYDLIVRVGGDEFICMLSGCSLDGARQRFTQVRALIAEIPMAGQGAAAISVGYAALRPEDSLESLTARADERLYRAKRGR